GGHLDVQNATHLTLEASIVEKFGHCGDPDHGPRAHGVYLESGRDLVIRDNVIRANASRGIQLYTQGGEYGALASVRIEHNLIQGNGYGHFEDGLLLAGGGTGTITDVAVTDNVFADNAFAAIRFDGPAVAGVAIARNTFYRNGVRARGEERSQIN